MFWMKNMLPATTKRVAQNTSFEVNEEIRDLTVENLNAFQYAGEEAISDRIACLDAEWDTERIFETKAAACILIASIFGLKNKYWTLASLGISTFLLQHALQGWCPTLPIARKVGIRTAEEINNEKIVLKMMRKDFDRKDTEEVEELLKIAEM
jgi:Protein of unknown function (DUF2892).